MRIYGAYGENADPTGSSRSAYTGQAMETDTGWYVQGKRLYSPARRRFLAPDPFSPFDAGGVNRYAYCGGDPINRIDPSGNAWRTWLRGARAPGTLSRESGVDIATPTMTVARVAPELETMAVGAAIVPTGIMPPGSQPGSIVLGRVMAGGQGSSGVLPAAEKIIDTSKHFVSPRTGGEGGKKVHARREVTIDDEPDERRLRLTNGEPTLIPVWIEGRAKAPSTARVFAADSAITGRDWAEFAQDLRAQGITQLNVYTGAHGVPEGNNWSRANGERLDVSSDLYAQDLAQAREVTSSGFSIKVVNMFQMTESQMVDYLSKDGVHIMACCYGAADSAVMKATGTSQVTVARVGTGIREMWAKILNTP